LLFCLPCLFVRFVRLYFFFCVLCLQSQLEYLRLRSAKHEILVAPRASFTVIVFQEWGAAAQ
jgi:hypothetical protein